MSVGCWDWVELQEKENIADVTIDFDSMCKGDLLEAWPEWIGIVEDKDQRTLESSNGSWRMRMTNSDWTFPLRLFLTRKWTRSRRQSLSLSFSLLTLQHIIDLIINTRCQSRRNNRSFFNSEHLHSTRFSYSSSTSSTEERRTSAKKLTYRH